MHNLLNKSKFVVDEIKRETEDVITIFVNGENFAYKAGQYVMIDLDDSARGHGKMYTISSAPHEERIAISIKKKGIFSSALHALKVGDTVFLSGPFGHFYPAPEMKHVVFLAAGIGITPFLSVIKSEAQHHTGANITLYYSNKSLHDIAFFDELNALAHEHPWLTVHHHLTQSDTPNEMISSHERITIANMKDSVDNFYESTFYLCGAIGFVRDMRKELLGSGIDEDAIFTESFF